MQSITTSAISALESIIPDLLLHVSGGCRPCSLPPAPLPQVQQQQIVQLPPMGGTQPQVAQEGGGGGGDSVSIVINGVARA